MDIEKKERYICCNSCNGSGEYVRVDWPSVEKHQCKTCKGTTSVKAIRKNKWHPIHLHPSKEPLYVLFQNYNKRWSQTWECAFLVDPEELDHELDLLRRDLSKVAGRHLDLEELEIIPWR